MATRGGNTVKVNAACQDLHEETFGEEATATPAKAKSHSPNKRPWKAWNGDIRKPRTQGMMEDVNCLYLSQMQAGQYGTQTPSSNAYLESVCAGLAS